MLASLGAFFALLAILAVQVRAGGDPALGPAKPAAEVAQRRVIVHRVVLRRVVVTRPAPRSSAPAASAPPRVRSRALRAGALRAGGARSGARSRHHGIVMNELTLPLAWARPCACSRPPARRSPRFATGSRRSPRG